MTHNLSRFAIGTLTLAAAAAALALPKVLIVAAEANTVLDPHFTDVRDKLLGSGQVASVDIFNARTGTPTLEQLLAYDTAFVWSRESFADSAALGNVLADYVDMGGGVVTALYATGTTDTTKRLMGRWSPGYQVINAGAGAITGTPATLGQAFACVWISFNLNNVNGGSLSARPLGIGVPGQASYIPATWSDGKIMAIQGLKQRRIDLGLYPPSSDVHPSYWQSSSQGGALMGNAAWGAGSVRLLPNFIQAHAGTLFGGTFASMQQSDDQRFYMLNDEASPNSTVEIRGTLDTIFQFSTMRIDIESAATRTDLIATVELKRHSTGVWEQKGSFQPTLQDSAKHFMVGTTWPQFSPYLQNLHTVHARIKWVPTADLDAFDGWSESVDHFNVVMGLE